MFPTLYNRFAPVLGVVSLLFAGSTALAQSPTTPPAILPLQVTLGANGSVTVQTTQLSGSAGGSKCVPTALQIATAGVQSATAAENRTFSIASPSGANFATVDNAVYTTASSCSAPNTKSVVESYVLGHNAAQFVVNSTLFGGSAACSRTSNSLSVTAAYPTSAYAPSLTFTQPGVYPVLVKVDLCGTPSYLRTNVTVLAGSSEYDLPRCGRNNEKYIVCHNGHEICIDGHAVPAHLAHGDAPGRCAGQLNTNAPASEETAGAALVLETLPNPSLNGQFNVRVQAATNGPVQVDLFDMQGHLLAPLFSGSLSKGEQRDITVNRPELVQGLYLVRVQDGKTTTSTRVQVQK